MLLAASLLTERWYHWGGVALLLLAWAPWRSYATNSLGILVALYCVWLLGNALFITPVYAAESLYQPLMLFGGFAAVAASDRPAQIQLFRVGAALAAILALHGLLQYFFGIMQLNDIPNRASGTFMTPNTQGTAINLFLAPLAALYLVRGSVRTLALALGLFAGLVATESRGAMLALLASLVFLAIALVRGRLRQALPRSAALLAGLGAVWLLVVGMARFLAPMVRGTAEAGPTAATWLGRATWDRADIYAATFELIMERPFSGAGANMFFPLFETLKPDSLRDADYHYAHNDYLQVWLEFGAPGLLLLVLIVATALILALRSSRRAPGDALPIACGAALASCFAHALVDFPLYVPFVLMLTGAFLGALARHHGGTLLPESMLGHAVRVFDRVTPAIRWTLAFAALAWLSQPVIAQLAVNRSVGLLARGEASDAIYWQSVAQRLEPRHPAQYWAEAMIWREQAFLTRNPKFAARADALYVQGIHANPYEVANQLSRARLHRDFPELLENAAKPAEILLWSRRAVELRPQQASVQAEYARSLAKVGRLDEARALAQSLAGLYPRSESVKRLARDL